MSLQNSDLEKDNFIHTTLIWANYQRNWKNKKKKEVYISKKTSLQNPDKAYFSPTKRIELCKDLTWTTKSYSVGRCVLPVSSSGKCFQRNAFSYCRLCEKPIFLSPLGPNRINGATLSEPWMMFSHILYVSDIIISDIPPLGPHGDGKKKQNGQLHPHGCLDK